MAVKVVEEMVWWELLELPQLSLLVVLQLQVVLVQLVEQPYLVLVQELVELVEQREHKQVLYLID
jgi:hypothetical protein